MYPPTVANVITMSAPGSKPVSVVAHRAWREAQTMILAGASGGPRTLALLGLAGTGKTWLLKRLLADLRERGMQVRLEPNGEVSPQFPLGAVLLVDEAARLDRASLERLATQQRGVVVLADVPGFAAKLDTLARPPATIMLQTIDPEEVPAFIAEWAEAQGCGEAITEEAVARLVAHAGGTPRMIVQLAKAALTLAASAGRSQIGGPDIDEAAALKLGALKLPGPAAAGVPEIAPPLIAPPIIVPPRPLPPPRPVAEPAQAEPSMPAASSRARIRWPAVAALAAPSIAACAIAGWVATHRPLPPIAESPTTPSQSALEAAEMAPAPDVLQAAPSAVTNAPEVAAASLPAAALSRAPDAPATEASPAPQAVALTPPAPLQLPATSTVADLPQPSPAQITPPETVAALAPLGVLPPVAPPDPSASAPPTRPERLGAPGLAFIAQPGDTLPKLYARVYRGRRPPPYAAVLAANPRPIRPGALIVFPTPPGGWSAR